MAPFTKSNVSALLWGPINCSNEKDAVGFCSVVLLWFRSGWNLFWGMSLSLTQTQLGEEPARFFWGFFSSQDPEDHDMQFTLLILVIQIFLTLCTLHPFASTNGSQNSAIHNNRLYLMIYFVTNSSTHRVADRCACLDTTVLRTLSYHKTEPKIHCSSNWTEQDICVCLTTSFQVEGQHNVHLL